VTEGQAKVQAQRDAATYRAYRRGDRRYTVRRFETHNFIVTCNAVDSTVYASTCDQAMTEYFKRKGL
jgi:hypothetical protein